MRTKFLKYTIIIAVIIAACSEASAQAYIPKSDWNGLSIYVPQYTKHFVENPTYNVNGLFGSEGGNSGLALTYSVNKMHYSAGYIKNSYGDWSKFATIGITIVENRNNQLSFNIGLADNYDASYEVQENREILEKNLPALITNNNVMPVALLTYKRELLSVYGAKVGVQVNVTPIYINTGLFVKL